MPRVEHSSSQTAKENCTPLSEVSAAGTPNLLTQLLKKAAAQLVVEVLTSGCTAGEEGRGFGLPLCRAVARDPAGSFTLTTAERGGRAAPAAAVAVDRCSGTEGGEVFGLPPCRAIARDPVGSFILATAEGGGWLRASATTLALPGTCLTSEVSSARKDSCHWTGASTGLRPCAGPG